MRQAQAGAGRRQSDDAFLSAATIPRKRKAPHGGGRGKGEMVAFPCVSRPFGELLFVVGATPPSSLVPPLRETGAAEREP